MSFGIHLKHFIFRTYWIVASLVGVILLSTFLTSQITQAELIACLGILLPSVYFVQKQKVEELRLFKELFASFNDRYDAMNEALNSILNREGNTSLSVEDRQVLIDYFNLCGALLHGDQILGQKPHTGPGLGRWWGANGHLKTNLFLTTS